MEKLFAGVWPRRSKPRVNFHENVPTVIRVNRVPRFEHILVFYGKLRHHLPFRQWLHLCYLKLTWHASKGDFHSKLVYVYKTIFLDKYYVNIDLNKEYKAYMIFRSRHRESFIKKDVPKIPQHSLENICVGVSP